jgi:hypothetical protein
LEKKLDVILHEIQAMKEDLTVVKKDQETMKVDMAKMAKTIDILPDLHAAVV